MNKSIIEGIRERIVPKAENLLDIGFAGGNYTIMMMVKILNLNCTLVDLSKPMLDKAFERMFEQVVM